MRQTLRLRRSTDYDLLFDRGTAESGSLSQRGGRRSVEGPHKPTFIRVGRQWAPPDGCIEGTASMLPETPGNQYGVCPVSLP